MAKARVTTFWKIDKEKHFPTSSTIRSNLSTKCLSSLMTRTASGAWRNQNSTMTAPLWLVLYESLNRKRPLMRFSQEYTPSAAQDFGRPLVYWFT